MVLDTLTGLPSGSTPVTLRFICFPTASNVTIASLLNVPGVPFDFAGLSFHVPTNGLSAAANPIENTQTAATQDKARMRYLLTGGPKYIANGRLIVVAMPTLRCNLSPAPVEGVVVM